MPRYVFKCDCDHTREMTLSFKDFDALFNRSINCFECAGEFDHLENFVHDDIMHMSIVVQPINFTITP